MSVDEIKKFCNVHALLFESSLSKLVSNEESPGHPVYLFKLENREIEKFTKSQKELVINKDSYTLEAFRQASEVIGIHILQIHAQIFHHSQDTGR